MLGLGLLLHLSLIHSVDDRGQVLGCLAGCKDIVIYLKWLAGGMECFHFWKGFVVDGLEGVGIGGITGGGARGVGLASHRELCSRFGFRPNI